MQQTNGVYRAGIIGLGLMGGADQVSGDAIGGQQVAHLDGNHFAALKSNKRIQLVAGSSRDAGRRERFAAKSGCKTYADWEEMIGRESLDIVSVATYAPTHATMTIACAERGVRAIYCEKPMATRLEDAERMLSVSQEKGALLVINHNRRFNPNYRRLRDLVAEGKLGELTSGTIRWGNGRLGNVGTHMLDALAMLTGQKIVAVSATLDLSRKPDCRGPEFADPGGFGWVRLERGPMASVDAADYARGPGEIILNGTLGRATAGGPSVALKFWDGSSADWPAPAPSVSSMDRAVEEIVAALDGKSPFPYDAANGVRTLEAIVAFHASHARGSAWVNLPLEGSDRKIEVLSG